MPWQAPGPRTVEARRLYHDCGWGYKRIARELDVNRDAARRMVRPDRNARLKRQTMRRRGAQPLADVRRRHAAKRAIVVLLWHDDAPLVEIAERLGTTVNALGVKMRRMRVEGFDLPLRYRVDEHGRRLPGQRIASSASATAQAPSA